MGRLSSIGIALLVTSAVAAAPARAHPEPLMCAVAAPEPRELRPPTTARLATTAAAAEEAVCLPPRTASRSAERPAWSEPLSPEQTRAALSAADRALAEGSLGDALLQLRVVELGAPRIADRIALQRGDVQLALGRPDAACEAYGLAARSPSRDIAVRGQVGAVRCQLEAGERKGEPALRDLLRRYPELSERAELQLSLARAHIGWDSLQAAANVLRAIDLAEPESGVAVQARLTLEQLRARGVRVRALSPDEEVARAERLLARGPLAVAEAELSRLARDPQIKGPLSARVHLLLARLLRLQGRWDALARELTKARQAGAAGPDAMRLAVSTALFTQKLSEPALAAGELRSHGESALDAAPALGAGLPDAAAIHAQHEAASADYTRRVRALRGNRPIAKVTTAQLRALFDLALDHGDVPLLDEALTALAARKGVMPGMRFDLAMRAAGMASDERVLGMLETLLPIPSMRVPALYHHARALERLGRAQEAADELHRVRELDRSETRYYAMWAEQRLRVLQPSAALGPPAVLAATDGLGDDTNAEVPSQAAAVEAAVASPKSPLGAALAEPLTAGRTLAPAAVRQRAQALLEPLASAHGAAYPWLLRALDLIELERFAAAADELSEAYMAYRDAVGAPRLRAGLFAVYTNEAPPRRPADWPTRRARLALTSADQRTLREAAALLGDPGIALRFGPFSPTARPRAYADLVEAAARKHGVDPNLLLAVMRVESIYNRRIVSYAGAVGLMQIMPTTGRRIALAQGRPDYRVTDLLDPAVNVEMAAWYLSSLIARFDGRVPLAIAAYNGGPHNVRVWMRGHHPRVPLDAFLERIPFSQTHRYVRRVLTHYAAYLAQVEQPMIALNLDLPSAKPDEVVF